MAGTFSLNTASHATLSQVLVMTDDGLFDYLAQKSGSTVTVNTATQPRKAATLRAIKNPANGQPWLNEA